MNTISCFIQKLHGRLAVYLLIIAAVFLWTVNVFGTVAGDVDCSGDTDLRDAVLALKISTGIQINTDMCREAELAGDGRISPEDAIYALQVEAGIREKAYIWYRDADGDGYSDGTREISPQRPSDQYFESSELVSISGDTDDTDSDIHPDAEEAKNPLEGLAQEFEVTPDKDYDLVFTSAKLKVGLGAVKKAERLSINTIGETELPALDAGMVNVTGKVKGFRFLPHGMKFQKNIALNLPYDKILIPEGFVENDIKTYYFDEISGRWVPLDRESVDTATGEVISRTDHFTDMINAVVQLPESPQKSSYNPTQIKDIKVANPGAKINLIEPPQAGNQGSANLSYPIEVAPGRHGMQPQLAVQYNSGGGNGWMGIGWDLPMQAITIDTRWGVPRYKDTLETETYTLNGQQLTPLAHRGDLFPRTAEKIFHTRTEGAFQKIVRHGDNPKNYWWEITDKNGTRFFYGGDPDTGGPADDSTLVDDRGNIGQWALRRVQDSNGNTIQYKCVRKYNTGLANGTVMGVELYLSQIFYTGYETLTGYYEVKFIRDSEPGERRSDVIIDCRLGFKKVTADRLRKIEVLYRDEMIRSYEFGYKTGPFAKTLLTSIVQFDNQGQEFARHELEYFDEAMASGGYKGFGSSENWDTGDDNVNAGLIYHGEASAIGGTKTGGGGAHLYVGIAIGMPDKKVSIGGKIGSSDSHSEGILTLTDINGDGLPDKVFQENGIFKFRANRSGPKGTNVFGGKVPLDPRENSIGLQGISKEKSDMTSAGAEAYMGATIGMNTSNTVTEGTAYFSDVNGDGITDLVRNGTVTFGRPDDPEKTRPVPFYSPDSSDTPYPVGPAIVDTTEMFEDFQEIYNEMLENAPLHDTLRRWTAPFDGQISISGDITLIEDTSEERAEYLTADGVRVAIQHNASELWASVIEADNYTPASPQSVTAIEVQKGDRIYFRVQSRFDGAYDQVSWNPVISYVNVSGNSDANGFNPYFYQADKDFIPTGRSNMATTLPATGTIRISGDIEKNGTTSDDIRVVVLLNDNEVFSRTSGHDQTGSISLNLDLSVKQQDLLKLKIEADSPIDLTRIHWKPSLEYTSAENMDTVYDESGKPMFTFNPPYSADVYGDDNLSAAPDFWTAPASGNVQVSCTFTTSAESGTGALTVKRPGELAGKAAFDLAQAIADGTAAKKGNKYELSLSTTVRVTQGDTLYFALNTRDRLLVQKIGNYQIFVKYNGQSLNVPSALYFPAEEDFFGQPYRCWTYAGYNGQGERAEQPVNESDLVVPTINESQFNQNASLENPEDAEKLDPQVSPTKMMGIMFYPDPALDRWRGYDDSTWVSADSISGSRLGADYISVPTAKDYENASAVNRLSKSEQTGLFAGGGPVSGSFSIYGNSEGRLDFIDMNGDRFPDVVNIDRIQYSPMIGGLESKSLSVISGIRETETKSFSFGIGGNFSASMFNSRGNCNKSGLQMATLGISGNFGSSDDERKYDLTDINGDGLPDKVYDDGNAALNLGYRFASKESWKKDEHDIKHDEGHGESLSLGLSFNDGIYGFGGGVGVSESDHDTEGTWLDINGDGLADYVKRSGDVELNTGGGFASIRYPGISDVMKNVSIDQSESLYFTISIPLGPAVPIFLIINPGADANQGIGRPEVAIMDINGDGYADLLSSKRNKEIKVKLNPIGKTNLLKTVYRPLGATISLDYERDGNIYQMPQSRWNLTKVEVFDGFSGDGADKLLTTYRYEDGFYNRLEREFYGYKTLVSEQRNTTAENAIYRTTTQIFKNRNYYEKGLLISETMQDAAGHKYIETTNTYLLRNIEDRAILTDALKDSLTATVFPEMIRTDKKFYEGAENPGVSTYQTFEYDALGNVVHFLDAADAGSADDIESFIEYHNDATHYIVGKAKKIQVRSNGQLLRQREAAFEAGTGNLTQVRISLGSGDAVHDMSYDKYGNIVQQTGPANKSGQRYSLTYIYDGDVQTYVKQVKDSFGYISTSNYNLLWGEADETVDINNQKISYRFDSKGRTAGITGPYQQGTGRETLTFEYHPEAAVPYAVTLHYDNYQQKTDPIETVMFVDGLKRGLQTKKDGAVSTGKDNTRDVMIVSGRVIFDFVGRSVEQYYPVTENPGNQGQFNASLDNIQPTRTSYDVMDRALTTTLPDNTRTVFAYGFGADRNGKTRFETGVTDANNKSKFTYKDVRGVITSIREFNKGKTLQTSYEYDALKQIVQVKDHENNITSVSYDFAGRRTAIDSPDMGLTGFVYDNASNLVQKITANLKAEGKAIEYDYDYSRLSKIRYPDYTRNNVSYVYGEPGASYNRADRIVSVTDGSGKEERFYGPLGETVKTMRYIASETEGNNSTAPEIYVTEYTYDTYNRMREIVYPDGEELTYLYNSGGLAESATGKKGSYSYPYLKKLTYDKFEQRVFMEQGNGAETDYDYNPLNRRLTTLKARAKNRTFMDLAYDYDSVGNIMGLDNLAAVTSPNQFGGKTEYVFEYDDLYRLTASTGRLEQKNESHTYTLSMQYDDIHNITNKAQKHIRTTASGQQLEQIKTTYTYAYDYGSSRPHAPTHIGERTFSYDANGNQTGWVSDDNNTRRQIYWDEENRIQKIEDNKHVMTYTYNDAGERVIKTGPDGETVYVNQFFTVNSRENGTKHVFIGTGRIASKLVKGQENANTPADAVDMLDDDTGSEDDAVVHPGNSDPSGNAVGHSNDNTNNAGGNSDNNGNNGGGSGGGSDNNGTIVYEPDVFYYHANHLGSTSFVTDENGKIYQHIEYFPFGETWVEEVSNQHRVPYMFTSKELDRETGLYYFGARYYDPRTSVWASCDPILGDYLESSIGKGGIFNSYNSNLYHYTGQNPLKYVDPDGNSMWDVVKDFSAGAWAELKDTGAGLKQLACHPIQTTRALGSAIMHPKQTWNAIKKPYVEDWNNDHEARAIGRGTMAIAVAVLSAKGIDKVGKLTGIGGRVGTGYHATHPNIANAIVKNGFKNGTKPGRLGGGGVYVNSTVEGAIAEFGYHNPGVFPSVLKVKYNPGVNAATAKPPVNYVNSIPLNVDSITAPSLRYPSSTNTNILNNSAKATGVVK